MSSSTLRGNIYAVLAEETIKDEADHIEGSENLATDSEEEDPDLAIMHTLFDLVALEEDSARKPVFTKDLLEEIAANIKIILSDQIKPSVERSIRSLQYAQSNEQSVTIWKAGDNAKVNHNAIITNYLTRVELHPEFREKFRTSWKRSKELQALNADLTELQRSQIEAPYYLESYERASDTTHLNSEAMDKFHRRLRRMQKLWNTSASCAELCDVIKMRARKINTPITKIVCIGLSALKLDPHITVFSIAETLNAVNREKHANCAPVKIIGQDPCYITYDRILIQSLTTRSIDFSISNPETILAIDANTLVVSAFLPSGVPLMQIVADLFTGKPEEGPAMMLCDRMPGMSAQKRKYCLRNRDSPAVVRFLVGYDKWLHDFGELDQKLQDDVADGTEHKVKYWLGEMNLWWRKDN